MKEKIPNYGIASNYNISDEILKRNNILQGNNNITQFYNNRIGITESKNYIQTSANQLLANISFSQSQQEKPTTKTCPCAKSQSCTCLKKREQSNENLSKSFEPVLDTSLNPKGINRDNISSEDKQNQIINSFQESFNFYYNKFKNFKSTYYDIKTWKKDDKLYIKVGNSANFDNTINTNKDRFDVIKMFGNNGYTIQTTTIAKPNGDLTVTIKDNINNENYLDVNFKSDNKKTGWILDTNKNIDLKPIPYNTPLDMIGLGITTLWIGLQLSVSKPKKTDVIQKIDPCAQEGDNFFINHDIACNPPWPLNQIITNDGRIYIYLTCSTIIVNALNCCKQHDIDLWCAELPQEVRAADMDVVLCILNELMVQVPRQIKWLCFWDRWIFSLFYQQLAGLLFLFISQYTFTQDDPNLIGYGGKNRDSCLCGGKKPTYCCYPWLNPKLCCELDKDGNVPKICTPRNLCTCLDKYRVPKTDCKENPFDFPCFNCYYKCKYNENGDLIGKELITDPYGKLPCCAGTPGDKNKIPCML